MEEMPQYVQDVLDLIEYANGDAKKTVWGKKRAQAGHPKPFNLKYIGIGNEDLITDIFEERFTMIFNAVKEKYPEVTVIGTVGPFYEGSDYEEGWKFATKMGIPMVDEHYYNTPGMGLSTIRISMTVMTVTRRKCIWESMRLICRDVPTI
jgi:Alpha-L-arabinofuranosidase